MSPHPGAASVGWPKWLAAIAVASVVALAGLGWQSLRPVREVRLYDDAALPPGSTVAEPVLRVVVGSMISPQSTLDRYLGLVRFLGAQVGRKGVLVQRRTYFESNQTLASTQAELGFVCTGAWLQGERQGLPLDVLAVPVVGGKSTYRAALRVPTASAVRDLADLRGRAVAFVDALSLTGRLWLADRVRRQGEREDRFFGRVIYAGSHDRSILAVADGLCDAATVDDLVLEALLAARPQLASRIRVAEYSPPFGIPPVVAPRKLDPELRTLLTAHLLELHTQPQGVTLLAGLGVERFVLPPAGHFDSARALPGP